MRKKICKVPCLLLSLFTSLNLCSGKFGTLITDDVSKLALLKQNIPSNYEIPVSYIPKDVAGSCWVVLNIYPLEQSLGRLAAMFGDVSSNRANITILVKMLKDLRSAFDHQELETAMQVFQCHYTDGRLMSGLYFDYIRDVLHAAGAGAATQGTPGLSCKPPPCLNPQQTPGAQEDGRKYRTPLLLVLIPFAVCVVIVVLWQIKSGRCSLRPTRNPENNQALPSDAVASVTVSIPLQTLAANEAPAAAAAAAIPRQTSG